jgi:hypothetical protein
MKPSLKVSPARWLSRYDPLLQDGDSLPHLAAEFQPRRFGNSFGGGGLPWRRPGFSRLAREVLRSDASRTFAVETAVLGLVTLVSLWPVVVMIREVIRLLK